MRKNSIPLLISVLMLASLACSLPFLSQPPSATPVPTFVLIAPPTSTVAIPTLAPTHTPAPTATRTPTSTPTITPTPITLDPKNIKLAASYSSNNFGAAVLILRGDAVVYEEYQNGFKVDQAHALSGGSQSFWCPVAVRAQQDNILTLDDKVSDTITEWKTDPRKAQVTIRQLLSLTSGVDAGSKAVPPTFADALKFPAVSDPGSLFDYGPAPFQTFGELLKRKLALTGEAPLAYLKRRIFNPIRLELNNWTNAADGNPQLGMGAFLTAREWVKFGHLIRDSGVYQRTQPVLDPALLAECLKPAKANPAYGVTFWLNSSLAPNSQLASTAVDGRAVAPPGPLNSQKAIYDGAPNDLIMAAGKGQQRMYISPSLDLVIVRFGEDSKTFRDYEFLSLLLTGSK